VRSHYKSFETFDWSIRRENFIIWLIKEFFKAFVISSWSYSLSCNHMCIYVLNVKFQRRWRCHKKKCEISNERHIITLSIWQSVKLTRNIWIQLYTYIHIIYILWICINNMMSIEKVSRYEKHVKWGNLRRITECIFPTRIFSRFISWKIVVCRNQQRKFYIPTSVLDSK